MSETNVQVIRDVYAAFNRGDITAVMSLIDPNGSLVFEGPASVPWTGTYNGADGWGMFFQAVGMSLEGTTVEMEPFAAQGDRVVAAGRYRGKVKATGKAIDSPLVHLWTLSGGKIVACVEMTNTAAEAVACTA
ncbi:MAG: nuclear transport factor 2 family protein [Bryobacteraceae bacterium]